MKGLEQIMEIHRSRLGVGTLTQIDVHLQIAQKYFTFEVAYFHF